jgi:hypothetical protein
MVLTCIICSPSIQQAHFVFIRPFPSRDDPVGMASRPLYLLVNGRTSKARGHFAIFIPNASDVDQAPSKDWSCAGAVIHVVGNPMIGFHHQFKRNFNTYGWKTLVTAVLLGHVQHSLHVDPSAAKYSEDTVALGTLDAAALQVPTPRKSDIRAPVDGVCAFIQVTPWWPMLTQPSGGQQTLPGVDHGIRAASGQPGLLG